VQFRGVPPSVRAFRTERRRRNSGEMPETARIWTDCAPFPLNNGQRKFETEQVAVHTRDSEKTASENILAPEVRVLILKQPVSPLFPMNGRWFRPVNKAGNFY
jgi:hypothetical protein